jgi:hypothetical protein
MGYLLSSELTVDNYLILTMHAHRRRRGRGCLSGGIKMF